MKLVHINVVVSSPQMTESEAMEFCDAIDVDGELHDKILLIVKNHIFDRVREEIAELVKIVVD